MFDGFDREIDIESGPADVVGFDSFDLTELRHSGGLEPGEVLERDAQRSAWGAGVRMTE